MTSPVVEQMRRRAKQVHTRATVRAWRYRQRHHAAGVWFRLRRVLADAKAAYAISLEDAQQLVAEGCLEATCGLELAPAKRLVFVDGDRLSRLTNKRPIRVDLGPSFLGADAVALVGFGQ